MAGIKLLCLYLFLLVLMILGGERTIAQAQHWLRKGAGAQQNEALAVTVDAFGNSYTTGYFSNTITFGSLNATSSGSFDIFLTKTDSTGNFIWLVTAGGSGIDKGYSIKTDLIGNIYITGIFTGSATFGSSVLVSSSSSQDVFIAKYNSSGVFQWAKKAGGAMGDAANSVATDNFGNVFITGFFEGQAQFDAVTLTSTINPSTNQYSIDPFIAKYNSSGNLVWAKQGSTKEYATGIDLAADAFGNIYVTGQFSDTITFDVIHPNNSFNSIFVVKYDSSGVEQWFKRIGSGVINAVTGITCDNLSNVYLTGNFQGGTIIFGSPNITLTNTYPERIFVIKFNDAGNVIWTKTGGSTSPVTVKDISVDNAGNAYLTGSFHCKFSEYADQYGQGTFNSVGFKDVFVSKYDSSGNWLWARQFGGKKDDVGNGISIDPNNHAVICGNFTNAINFPVNTSHFYPPIGDYSPFSINNNITYCGDSAYGTFATLQGTGTMDLFIAKPVDLSREPYDYYKRSGTGCNRDVVFNCMRESGGFCVPDTIIKSNCNSLDNNFVLYALINAAPGPDYTMLWSNNTTVGNIFVANPGVVSLTTTSEDGCFISNDTSMVIFNTFPLPPAPPVSDSYGLNINSLNPTTPILICPPDSQVILTGVNTGLYYYWTNHYPGNSPLSITVNVSGVYSFTVGTADSCEVSTEITVTMGAQLDSLVPAILAPDTVTGCGSGALVEFMAFNSLLPDTFCIFPPVTTTWTTNNSNVNWLQPTCLSDGIFIATQTGLYQIDGTIIRQNPCGISDTHYVSTSVYVEIFPDPPPFTINITGDLYICPGNTTTLTASGAPPGATYQWYDLFNGGLIGNGPSITLNQAGNYYVVSTVSNTYGCIASNQQLAVVNFTTVPVIQMNPASGIICPGSSVDLICPATSGSWQWFGPSGSFGGNTNSVTVNTPGQYYCIYTNPDGCELNLTPVQVQQYATPFLATGPSSVICPGETVTIEVMSNGSGSVQWLSPLSGSNPIQIISSAGTYTALVTSCGIQTTTSVTITASIVEAIINPVGPISICSGDSILLTANPGMTTYNWMPGNISSQDLLVNQSGLYELTTTEGGCSATASVEVFTYLLDAPFALDDTICIDSTATLTGYSFTGTIGWFDAPNGNLLDTGAVFSTPTLLNTTTYYIQSFDSVCYSTFEPVTVFILPSIPAPIVSSNSPVCTGNTIFLETTFSDPNANYLWSGPGGFNSGLQNPVITNATLINSGLYQLIIDNGGCPSEAASVFVQVSTIPQFPQIISDSIFCEGDSIIITTDTIAGATYYWTGPAGFSSSSPQIIISAANSSHSGIYSISISLDSCQSDTSSINILINTTPAAVNAGSNSPICSGDSLILNSTFITGYNYTWTGPYNFSSNNNIEIIYPSEIIHSGNYILNVEYNGCTSPSAIINVTVNQIPEFTLGDNISACSGSTIIASPDQQFPAYLWSNGYNGYELNINQSGIYILTVSDINGCRATDSLLVEFVACNNDIPNIFTPNNDGYNDVFSISAEGFKEIQCKIYNRWGDLIYEFDAKTDSWDGTHQSTGKPCTDGVYYYIAGTVDHSLVQNKISGFIRLVNNK